MLTIRAAFPRFENLNHKEPIHFSRTNTIPGTHCISQPIL